MIPSVRARGHLEVYDVQRVEGIEDATLQRHPYVPFYSFRQHATPQPARTYTVTRRVGTDRRPEVYLNLHLPAQGQAATLMPETLSTSIHATNGNVPNETFSAADGTAEDDTPERRPLRSRGRGAKARKQVLDQLGPEAPQVATVKNLTKPTARRFPPLDRHRDLLWKLIAHWSFNYLSVATREAVVGVLDLYDWTASEQQRRRNQQRMNAIEEVQWAPAERLYRGSIIRGTRVTITIREAGFVGEGDLCLFGLVMSRFFALYATINSFVDLVIKTVSSEKEYQWMPRRGNQSIL